MERQIKIKFQAAPGATPVDAIITIDSELPNVLGEDGQVLTVIDKAAGTYGWAPPAQTANELPAVGTAGQVLTVIDQETGAFGWQDLPAAPVEVPDISQLADGDYKLSIVGGVPSWVAIV